MRPLILCRERWERIERVLAQLGGTATLRELERSFAIRPWEVRASAALGWLDIATRRPRTGRPSQMVVFRDYTNANVPDLPEYRCGIEKDISSRHRVFVLRSIGCVRHGSSMCGSPPIVHAYLSVYRPRSRCGARASMSRLLRHPDVRALRQWFYAQVNHEISFDEPTPRTASGIWQRLREVGSWRARLSG